MAIGWRSWNSTSWTWDDKLTSVPAEIGQLTSLTVLTSRQSADELPAEIGQLTSLRCWTSAAIS